jgi:hypothetical protein
MAEIIINSPKYGSYVVLVDDEDFDELNQFNWNLEKSKNTFYAKRKTTINKKNCSIKMHRQIMKLTKGDGLFVDHKDHNGLNNQKNNLRIATIYQNNQNSTSRKNSTSKYLGVAFFKATKKWHSQISINKKLKHIGFFTTEIEAALAYNKVASENFKEYANLNKI